MQNVNIDSIQREQKKIIFQYGLMLVASMILGWTLKRFLSQNFLLDTANLMAKHFSIPFAFCNSAWEYLQCIFLYALPDLISFFLIFMSAFTVFNYVLVDVVLVYLGLRSGFSIGILMTASHLALSFSSSLFHRICFVCLRFFILAMVFWFSYQISLQAFRIKRFSPVGRLLTDPKRIFTLCLFSVAFLALVTILNGLYCLLIYIT